MSKSERNKRAIKKRREDPNPNREGKAKMVTSESGNPLMTGMPKPQAAYEKLATDLATDLKKQATLRDAKNARIKQQASQSKMSEEKDACYRKVKSRYKIWPSAYASGALVKCRKVGADNWGNKKEDYNFSNWRDDFKATEIETIDLIKPDPIKIIEKKEDPCWDGYKQEGMKKKGKKMVPNCVPEEVEVQRYCPKCKKEETRSECKFGPKYWDLYSTPVSLSSDAYDPNDPHPANEEKDHEYSMARSEISTIINAAKRLKKKMGKGEGNIEAWVQSKITKAADYLDSAADYVDSGEMKNESIYNEQKLSKTITAKGEGGSPYEPYNKPKGPSQPTQPPGGFDKFREKYGIPKKPSLQIAHYIQDNDLVDEQVKPIEGPYDKFDRLVNASRIPSSTKSKVEILKKAARIYPKVTKIEDSYESRDDLIEYSNWREDFKLLDLENEVLDENLVRLGSKLASKVIKAVGKTQVRKSLPPLKLKNLSPSRRKEVMHQAQKRVLSYKPGQTDKVANKKHAASVLNTKYGARQDILSKGGTPKEAASQSRSSLGPGDNTAKDFNIKRSGRGRKGFHGPETDRGKGNKAARRAGEPVLDTGDKKLHYRPTRTQSIERSRQNRQRRSVERRLNNLLNKKNTKDNAQMKSIEKRLNNLLDTNFEQFSNWRSDFGLNEQSAYGPQKGGWKIGQPVGQHLAQKSTSQKIKDAGAKYGKKVFEEDWQKVNRQDKTDGLSQAAVDAYRRENPGSKLQTAVTEKKPKGKRAKRRANFCRRMKGMKSELTSAKTARDPDSRINKALRRWRCR
jgi:hypothetical protein